MKLEEFGQKVKAKYPQYQSFSDAEIGQKMLAKYPQYQSQIDISEKPKVDLLQKVGNVVNAVFPGKQVGQAIGTLAGYIGSKDKQFYDTSAPSPLQVAGDIGQGALSVVAPNVGTGASALGRIGANALLGAGVGVTGAVAQGQNAKDVLKQGAIGGALGGGVSAVGEGIRTIAQSVPKWLTKAALPKLENKNLDYAVKNVKLGSLSNIQKSSNQAMRGYEDEVQNVLNRIKVPANTQSVLDDAISNFPNAEYTTDDLLNNAKNIAPKVSKLITKFQKGEATIQELNTIRKELDVATKSVYTSLNRPPEAKLLGATLAGSMRDYVKKIAPQTVPVFDEYAKEVGLNKAIQFAVKKGEQKITFKDIIAGGAGFSQGGLKGALSAILAERLLFNPASQLGAAKLVQGATKISAPIGTALLQGGKVPLIKSSNRKK